MIGKTKIMVGKTEIVVLLSEVRSQCLTGASKRSDKEIIL